MNCSGWEGFKFLFKPANAKMFETRVLNRIDRLGELIVRGIVTEIKAESIIEQNGTIERQRFNRFFLRFFCLPAQQPRPERFPSLFYLPEFWQLYQLFSRLFLSSDPRLPRDRLY